MREGRTGRIVKITKRDNHFQRLEVLLRNREKRHRYGEFLVEGFLALERAIAYRWTIRSWVYSSVRGISPRFQELMDASAVEQHFDISPELLAEISEKDLTSELLAIVETPPDDPSRFNVHDPSLFVVFDRPQNPGNLGTNIRTCDALGATGALVLGHSVDLYDPETVRASVGSLFALPTLRKPSWEAAWEDIRSATRGSPTVVGTSAHGTMNISECALEGPLVLLVGNEKTGLSRGLAEAATHLVKIPQSGAATSLNVSCATAIALYEIQRQRALKK